MNSAFSLINMNHETKLPGQKGEPGGRRRTTVQVTPGPTVGIITLRGWRGWPSRQGSIGCPSILLRVVSRLSNHGWKARPFGPPSEEWGERVSRG
jgi:hypothetical protein